MEENIKEIQASIDEDKKKISELMEEMETQADEEEEAIAAAAATPTRKRKLEETLETNVEV